MEMIQDLVGLNIWERHQGRAFGSTAPDQVMIDLRRMVAVVAQYNSASSTIDLASIPSPWSLHLVWTWTLASQPFAQVRLQNQVLGSSEPISSRESISTVRNLGDLHGRCQIRKAVP